MLRHDRCGMLLLLILLVGCRAESGSEPAADSPTHSARSLPGDDDKLDDPSPPTVSRPFAETFGTTNTDPLDWSAPRVAVVEEVDLPAVNGRHAIWGASGRDESGHLWFGVSVGGARSAHLIQYDPVTGRAVDRGGVVEQLAANQLAVDGISQTKIHSKIWQADDGYLYFTSSDEQGEKEDGSQLPQWGSHLWRIAPPSAAADESADSPTWEHLFAAPEGLIALACSGRYLYALGYFGHVVYQWDTQTQTRRSAIVGAAGGHISRNLVADRRGHVYVPRVVSLGTIPNAESFSDERSAISTVGSIAYASSLVELDPQLREVQQLAFPGYAPDSGPNSHGITAFCYLEDGRIVLATHVGQLYVLTPPQGSATDSLKAAEFRSLGPIDAEKAVYPAGMVTIDGRDQLAIMLGSRGDRWLVRNVEGTQQRVVEPIGMRPIAARPGLLLYGSHTRGDDGSGYIVGRWTSPGGIQPTVVRLQFGQSADSRP